MQKCKKAEIQKYKVEIEKWEVKISLFGFSNAALQMLYFLYFSPLHFLYFFFYFVYLYFCFFPPMILNPCWVYLPELEVPWLVELVGEEAATTQGSQLLVRRRDNTDLGKNILRYKVPGITVGARNNTCMIYFYL